jgi:hypothetical protein
MAAAGGGKSAAKQQISVKGEVADSTRSIVYLDGQVVNKLVQRRLLRFSDAAKSHLASIIII